MSRLADFDFHLPSDRIAQHPAEPRDAARLLVYDRLADRISHAYVRDVASFLPPTTTLVANNSKVRNARVAAAKDGKPLEVLVLEPAEGTTYRCLVGGKGLKEGDRLSFFSTFERKEALELAATVTGTEEGPGMTTFLLRFESPLPLETVFEKHGTLPLPPYIKTPDARPEQYQTVYAKEVGSAAAPTAGLHFTPRLIQELQDRGHQWKEVTLHVGIGTFLPLRTEEIAENRLHREATFVPSESAAAVNAAREAGKTILAIGTTSTRTLESHTVDGKVAPGEQATDLFIYPGYAFRTVNALLTNFHLPHSSLLVLVAAFLGNHPTGRNVVRSEAEMVELLQKLYATAIKEGYRFYSFGDAMLIL